MPKFKTFVCKMRFIASNGSYSIAFKLLIRLGFIGFVKYQIC